MIEQSLTVRPVCPHCAGTELHRWGRSCGLQRYRCCGCNRTFNAQNRTPLAGLRHKDKWLNYEQAMVQRLLRHDWLGNAKVVLTTYETLRDLEFTLAAQKWSAVICDEAQKIKNQNPVTEEVVRRIIREELHAA